jgi:hypothetical protein
MEEECNDILIGGDEDDILSGEDGDDILYCVIGNDIMRGGTGANEFVCEVVPEVVLDCNPSQSDVVPTDYEIVSSKIS